MKGIARWIPIAFALAQPCGCECEKSQSQGSHIPDWCKCWDYECVQNYCTGPAAKYRAPEAAK